MARFNVDVSDDWFEADPRPGEQEDFGVISAEDLEAYYDEGPSTTRRVLEFLLTILLALGLMVVIRIFVVDSYIVPSGSMLQTIQLGDRLIGEKISYRMRTPRQGEIITFYDPDPTKAGMTLIKRVIAVEGQTVDFADGIVYVDGVALKESYVQGQTMPLPGYAPNLDSAIVYPYTVPEGCVWVMGDNRENSLDSRYFGPVELEDISSHALFIYWPPEDMGALEG